MPTELKVAYNYIDTGDINQYDSLISTKIGCTPHSAGSYLPLSVRELIYSFKTEYEANIAQTIILRLTDDIESIIAEVRRINE